MVGAMVSKSLIQFSTDGQGCVPSLLLDLRPNYGGANEDNGELLQKVPCKHCCTQCLWPSSRSPPTHASTGDSWKLISMSGSVSCGVTSFFWVLMHTGFVCALQESVSPVLCKFWWFHGEVNADFLQEGLCHTVVCCTQSPCSRSLLTHTSTGDTQTQFWLNLSGLGMLFVPFPGLSTLGDQVLDECTVPRGPCVLITSPVLAAQYPGCAARALSQVCCMSPLESWSQAVTLLVDVNHPGSQEDVVSSWEPAHSLGEDDLSGAEIVAAPCLPALAVTSLPLCLWERRGWQGIRWLDGITDTSLSRLLKFE